MPALKRFAQRFAIKSRATVSLAAYRLRHREDGIAAVEFALIAPIMACMVIGSIEMSAAVTVDRRVSQVAATTGDLTARFDGGARPSEISEVSRIGSWILGKTDAHKLKVVLRLVTVMCPGGTCPGGAVATNYDGQRVRWQCTFDPDAAGTAAAGETPPRTYAEGAATASATCECKDELFETPREGLVEFEKSPALVVSDVEFRYTPMFFHNFMYAADPSAPVDVNGVPTFTLKERLYHKPRGALIELKPENSDTPTNRPDNPACKIPGP